MTDPDGRRAKLMAGWIRTPGPIRTIADFIWAEQGVRVECRACGHVAMLDLVSLGAVKGRDADVYRIIGALACSIEDCRARNPFITIASHAKSRWARD